jgi:hypothetical protein
MLSLTCVRPSHGGAPLTAAGCRAQSKICLDVHPLSVNLQLSITGATLPLARVTFRRGCVMETGSRSKTFVRPETVRPMSREDRTVGVRDALAMVEGDEVVEVYVGWALDPVRVVSRKHFGSGEDWSRASERLRERVRVAIQPLIDIGWRMDGSPVSTMRWDTTYERNGQEYEGCWVRMRARSSSTHP